MGSAITKMPERKQSHTRPQVTKQWSKMRGWTQKAHSIETSNLVPDINIDVPSPIAGKSKSTRDLRSNLHNKKSFDTGSKMSVHLSKTLSPLTRRFSHRRSQSASAPSIKRDMCEFPRDDSLSAEVVRSWDDRNTGFESLLKSREGRRLFEEFLKKEFSSENIQFWTAVEQLKGLQGGEKIFRQHVDVIFKIYINDTALSEVSLDSKVKQNLMRKKDDPPRDIFEEAQAKIFSLMHRDSFPRFMNSPVYKQLWEEHECDLLPSSSSSSSSSPSLSRSSSTDSVFYRRNRLSIQPESVIKPKLGDDIEFMLASLKDFKRSFSGHSEADDGDEEYVLARDHVGQILDEIIEEVLTIEELRQMNSI